MQKRTITFNYIGDENIKVGDLLWMLCKDYKANEILSDNSCINLGELLPLPMATDVKKEIDKKDIDEYVHYHKLFQNDLDRIKILKRLKSKKLIDDFHYKHLGYYIEESYHSDEKGNKSVSLIKNDNYRLYSHDYDTLIAIYDDAKNEFDKVYTSYNNKPDVDLTLDYHINIECCKNNRKLVNILKFLTPEHVKKYIISLMISGVFDKEKSKCSLD